MNNNMVKCTVDEVVGIAKRKAGKLTGNTSLQVEGLAQQIKGKLESAVGKTKDAILRTNHELKGSSRRSRVS
jgi:uncharacterized protein YjbJ (UPF0337 family)